MPKNRPSSSLVLSSFTSLRCALQKVKTLKMPQMEKMATTEPNCGTWANQNPPSAVPARETANSFLAENLSLRKPLGM